MNSKVALVINKNTNRIMYSGKPKEVKSLMSKRGKSSLLNLAHGRCEYVEVPLPLDREDKTSFMEYIESGNLRGLIYFHLPSFRFLLKG